MSGSMTTFGTDRRTDRQTDGADYIGPAVRPMRRVQKGKPSVTTLQIDNSRGLVDSILYQF